jgi:acetyltransferase
MDRILAGSPDGLLLLRQAGPADDTGIREFVCGLSHRTQRLRFFACVAPPSTGLLRALCGGPGRADILLVTDGQGSVIAHGMAADVPAAGGHEASIGLVVADAWQRRGIGARMLSALVGRAASRGARSLVLDVLPDNDVMLGIIARRWPDAPAQRTPDALVFRPAIGAAPHPIPVPAFVSPGYLEGPHASDRSAA